MPTSNVKEFPENATALSGNIITIILRRSDIFSHSCNVFLFLVYISMRTDTYGMEKETQTLIQALCR